MVKELAQKIIEEYPSDAACGLHKSQELKTLAKEQGATHEYLVGRAYESAYQMLLGNLKQSIQNGKAAAEEALEQKELRIYVFLRNILGVAYYYENDEQSALENYYSALQLSMDHGFEDLTRKLYQNIGFLYLNLHAYEKAEEYNRKSLQISMEEDLSNTMRRPEEYAEPNLLESLFAQKKYQQAFRCLEAIRETRSEAAYRRDRLEGCALVEAELFLMKGETEAVKELLCDLYTHVESDLPDMNKFDEYSRLICFTLEHWKEFSREEQEALLLAMQSLRTDLIKWSANVDAPGKKAECFCMQAEYAAVIQDEEQEYAALENYYVQDCLHEKHLKKEKVKRIQNWVELEHMQEESRQKDRQSTKLNTMAQRDELTGLANRYGLHCFLENHYKDAVDHEFAVGVMMADIDNFKYYNDQFGHLEGDRRIRELAGIVENCAKDAGFAVRYGGDEFLVVFIRRSDETMRKIADAILMYPKDITVSIGLYNTVPEQDTTMEEIIREADRALYKAKRNQKNMYYMEVRT